MWNRENVISLTSNVVRSFNEFHKGRNAFSSTCGLWALFLFVLNVKQLRDHFIGLQTYLLHPVPFMQVYIVRANGFLNAEAKPLNSGVFQCFCF